MKCKKLWKEAAAMGLTLAIAAGCAACTPGSPADGPEPTPVNTRPFNEGIVNYTVTDEVIYVDPYSKDKLGTIINKKHTGALTLMEYSFSAGDAEATCDGDAVMRDPEVIKLKDGKLYIPYNEAAENNLGGAWTTWAPTIPALSSDYLEGQLSFDGNFGSDGASAWMGTLIGVYKQNVGTIADNPGDGIYIGFNSVAGTITVYGGNEENWAWPAGNCSINVKKDLIEGDTHLDIVATADKTIKVYLKKTLCLTIKCRDSKMVVENSANKEIYSGDLDMESISGEYFSIFAHGGGVALKNISILAASKGEKQIKKNVIATPTEGNKLGLDITDKKDLVSICYTNWFNAINGNGTGEIKARNVSELLEKYEFTLENGFGEGNNAETAFHYWGKPAQGYYRSTDKEAHKNNMNLIYAAGVDFIIIDYTYATSPTYKPGTDAWNTYIEGPTTALLDSIMELRAEGKGTPYVVFWMGSNNMFEYMQKYFLNEEKWKDCFVYWDEKPFILEWVNKYKEYSDLTVRGMYGLQSKVAVGQWSYLEINNANTVAYDAAGNPEHICVDVATQETYMSLPSAHGRQGGRFWNEQWQNAFKVHPKIVTVTWWNEWCAQLYKIDGVGWIFTDNFNQEYSRDIEPMEGGHGDLYYRWLCQYVSDYKAGKPCPELIEK